MRRILWMLLVLSLGLVPALAQDNLEARIAAMTLEQRVAQMFMVTLHGAGMTEVGAALLREWQPGAVVLFTSNTGTPPAVTVLTNDFQRTITEAGGPPLLISIDQEGGVVSRLTDGFSFFPTPLLVAAAGEDMAFRFGQALAHELSAVGINMNLAPVADLETNPDNPIIARRAFGSDPNVTAPIIAQVVRGTQALGEASFNVLATVKHFPGHGETSDDSHAVLERLDLTRERLETTELVPFQAAIDAGVAAVMVAHIWFPAFDPDAPMPASLSRNVVTGLLREEMGFDGIIMTDAMDMNAVDMTFNLYDAVVMAVEAGVDLVSMGPSIDASVAIQAMQRVVDEVRAGRISEARINESVRRILATKQRFGILNWQPLDEASAAERIGTSEHAGLLTELFEAGVTVAYDRGDLVPVTPDRSVGIVFLATRYQIQAECQTHRSDIRWVGVSDNPSQEEIGWATGAANQVDTIVVFTQNGFNNLEQQALVNALPQEKTVAVSIWSPYDWQTYPDVAAYVATYSPARESIPAACAILFGALPARGVFPLTLGDGLVAGSHDGE